MLITCDGPIEPDWVENMNSVLDDNKRLSLITGETLYLTNVMNVVLEASRLDDCTPATISRCGICYIRKETLPAKAQFNHWLQCLPKILKDQQERLDLYANYFITDIFQNFMVPEKLIYPVSQAWAILTFIRVFDALIYQYRNEKYTDQRSLRKVSHKIMKDQIEAENKKKLEIARQLRKAESIKRKEMTKNRLRILERTNSVSGAQRASMEHRLLEDGTSSGLTSDADSAISAVDEESDGSGSDEEGKEEEKSEKGSATGRRRKELQKQMTLVESAGSYKKPEFKIEKQSIKLRPPEHTFVDNEQLFENSIKNKNQWIDAFFLYSVVWSFGAFLNQEGRREFNTWMITAMKNKDATRREMAENVNYDDASSESPPASEEDVDKARMAAPDDAEESSDDSELPYVATQDFVIGQVDHMEVSLPYSQNVFDVFFDVNTGAF